MRTYIAHALYSDTQLASLGVTREGTYAGDVDSPTQRPYLVLRWLDTSRGVGRSATKQRNLTIYVHDGYNDYTRIDAIVRRIRQVFESIAGARTATGWITQVDWLTDSGDLSDDTSRTIMRTTSYNVVGSGM